MVSIRPQISSLKPYVPGVLEPGKIKLASNENPLGSSPRAIEAMKNLAGSAYLYPEDNAPHLGRALSRRYGLDENWFIVGNGSDEILQLAPATFLREGEECLVSEHTFSVYTAVSTLFGGKVRTIPMAGDAYDLTAFAKAIGPATRIIFICSPNNPTGSIVDKQQLERFLTEVPTGVLVVLDEAYAEFVDNPAYQDSRQLVRRFPNLLVTRTFSKIYGLAGLRVGYGMAQPEVIANLQRSRPPFNVNAMAQAAAVAALEDQDFIQRSLKVTLEGRQFLESRLAALGLHYIPSQSNFICVDVKRDAKAMYQAICDGGVTIRPLTSFGLPTRIRVSVGTPAQNQVFLSALEAALSSVPLAHE